MTISAKDINLLAQCHAKSPDGWEPKDPRHPFFDRMIEAGFLKRADGRCGFEAFKESHVVFTAAGKMAIEAEIQRKKGPEAKTGAVLVFTHGEYSDYRFTGPVRVIKDFDQAEIVKTFREQFKPTDDNWDRPDTHKFIGWLTKTGYVEHMDTIVWHIGEYDNFDPRPIKTAQPAVASE